MEPYVYNCNLVKIVDGDTIDVDIDLGFGVCLKKQRIRLEGINAPESRTRNISANVTLPSPVKSGNFLDPFLYPILRPAIPPP